MGLKDVFKKADIESLLVDLSSILDLRDIEIIVVRGKNCDVLFASAKAQARMSGDTERPAESGGNAPGPGRQQRAAGLAGAGGSGGGHGAAGFGCKRDYAHGFEGLCECCPYGNANAGSTDDPHEVAAGGGRSYSVRANMTNWIDGKPAAILMLRDVTPEKEAQERLYNLAYVDQLTQAPNRQKLKEDFSAIEESIEDGTLTGIISIFDLDNFKVINDTYGHNTGDVVLRRLSEHLAGEKEYEGHVYRLGGDEFVFLYSGPQSAFKTDEEMKEYYNTLLSGALRAYTIPNIEAKCTLSMGVSMFPKHGTNLSDVLRKADIALYKAKAEGRDRIVFFEDRYDTAQKLKDIYINIQPILLDYGNTFGYELIERGTGGDLDEGIFSMSGSNGAMDVLELCDIEDESVYFISYTKQLLDPTVLRNLPMNKFIIQLAPPAKNTKAEIAGQMQICTELKESGYKISMAGLNSSSISYELLSFCDYAKFKKSDANFLRQKRIVEANPGITFIASGVDTPDVFRRAKDIGFKMFQGYYFNQPVKQQKTKELSPLKVNYFRLLKLCSTDDYMDFREISSVISSDVALSYKLLRILNSAAVGLRNVSSISSAVAYIGEESLKKWVAVLALRGIAEDKPIELIRMSLIRARFGELLAPHMRVKRNPQHVFMVGILSLIHIALEKTREQLLEEIPVSDDIRESLITKSGVYSDLLRFFENYEYANWDAVSSYVEEHLIGSQCVNDSYIAAVRWYNDLAEA